MSSDGDAIAVLHMHDGIGWRRPLSSDVNKDWTCKDKDQDKDKDKDFTYSYLLQFAAKHTIAINQSINQSFIRS